MSNNDIICVTNEFPWVIDEKRHLPDHLRLRRIAIRAILRSFVPSRSDTMAPSLHRFGRVSRIDQSRKLQKRAFCSWLQRKEDSVMKRYPKLLEQRLVVQGQVKCLYITVYILKFIITDLKNE